MSPLLGRRSAPPLARRLQAVATATDLARGRLPDDVVDRAATVVRRAGDRLALSGEHTVVALAGATGSGKSSLLNALVGETVSVAGVRRPTTATTTAAVWGEEPAADLLAWLDVPRVHRVAAQRTGDPDLDVTVELDGLVLLDLPDHDSTEVAHHLEVDRLVGLVDLLVWVVDPQKYADAALHDRYLAPLASHRDVMVVVLNQVDTLPAGDRPGVLADLRRRLAADGLPGLPVLTTSATTGDGLPALRELLAVRVREKRAAGARLSADLDTVAADLAAAVGQGAPGTVTRALRGELVDALADAAGVPTVVRAVERSVRLRGGRRTGWPVTSWLSRLRPDPLRRLHLDGPRPAVDAERETVSLARTSLPAPTPVQRARVDAAVRTLCDEVTTDLSRPVADAVRRQATGHLDDLGDALDRAVAGTDLGVARTPWWWAVARALQLVLALALVAGALWLLGLLALGALQLPEPTPPRVQGLPVPTLLLVAGAGGGLALGMLGRVATGVTARSRARTARRRLRASLGEVAEQLVLSPVEAELAAYRALRDALA